jgi:hypothetical protein
MRTVTSDGVFAIVGIPFDAFSGPSTGGTRIRDEPWSGLTVPELWWTVEPMHRILVVLADAQGMAH